MKKLQIVILAVWAAALFASCSSTKTAEESADTYGTVITPASPSGDSSQTEKKDTAVQKQQIVVPQKGNAFTRFFTGSQKDIELGTTKIFQLTITNGLKQEDAMLIYNIKTEKIGFSAGYQGAWYHLLFDASTRSELTVASKQYLSDFAQKKLSRKNRKSYKVYGDYPVTIEWGTIPGMRSGYADTHVQFGYEFKKQSPYFTMTVWQTPNLAYKEGTSEVPQSITLHFYMTKAQVSQMAEMLSDQKIQDALQPYLEDAQENKNPKTDKY